jgi:peptidoglycan/xylan/chitin deacetylase (PgdA/CDA1 family)
MSKKLELVIAACFYYCGLVRLVRWWTRRAGSRLIILCYHHGNGANFRQQLRYLNRHYRVLHLEDALQELYHSQPEGPRKRDRRTLVALTFDDGYHNNYTDGFAVTRETKTPMTIFLIPGYMESGNRYWWEEPDRLVEHTRVREATIDGRTYHLDTVEERSALRDAIETRVRIASSVAEREVFLCTVRKALDESASLYAEEKPSLPLTWPEVHEMEASGWISFGGHTMYHPILGYLADPAEAEYEVCESRVVLEKALNHPVRTFAYPYGRMKHIGDQGLSAVRAADYEWAVTTIHGVNTPHTDPHLLHRILVGADQHWLVVAAKTSGVWEFFLRRAARQEVRYG